MTSVARGLTGKLVFGIIRDAMNPISESNDLARLLREARGDVAMQELARRSGVSAAQISRIEAGSVETPTLETVSRLANALDRDPQLLLVALGRIEYDEAVVLVVRSISNLGRAISSELRQAGRQVEEAHRRVKELSKLTASLLNDWQELTHRFDQLTLESEGLEVEVGALEDSEGHGDDESNARFIRWGNEARARLKAVRNERKATWTLADEARVRRHEAEVELDEALQRGIGVTRETAGQLFVFGATSSLGHWAEALDDVDKFVDLVTNATLIQSLESLQEHDEMSESDARVVAARAAALEEITAQIHEVKAQIHDMLGAARNQRAHEPSDPDFRRLAAAWSRLTAERRARLLDFAEDQRRLSLQEQVQQEEVVIEEWARRSDANERS
jgi:transcriptional regulator with XRE-family HTH domain